MEELNKIISGLYAKIDNQEKIIRELQEEIQDLKADYGNLAQVERDFYKQALLDIKEYVETNKTETTYEYLGSDRIMVYTELKLNNAEYNELLDIINKAIGGKDEKNRINRC